ncbi:regulatory protein RecX [Pseudonocardia sp. TRM90224]|uniref:regulatory protein RecX n=1 Tax=Pseudonocardia sp. TRM90224 TaxID=2812678 RepID=UPI0027E12554|nr:regulatory protein RecX [Pseudonocardia sp. TRM90224]
MTQEPGGSRLARFDELEPADEAAPVAGLDGADEPQPEAERIVLFGGFDGIVEPDAPAPVAELRVQQRGEPARVADVDAGVDAPAPDMRVASLTGWRGRPGAGRVRTDEPEARRPRRERRPVARPASDVAAPEAPATADPEERGRRPRERRRHGPPELDPGADPIAVAKEICLRLLTDRARTRLELEQALRRKGVPDEAATTVLERFDEVGLIDDASFAEQWVRSRHNYRGLARRAIAQELRRKGVADDIAGEALAGVDSESEEQRARELVERKVRSLPVATAEERTRTARRLVGMLARKGYGGGIAYRVVREVLAAHGAESEELAGEEPAEE